MLEVVVNVKVSEVAGLSADTGRASLNSVKPVVRFLGYDPASEVKEVASVPPSML